MNITISVKKDVKTGKVTLTNGDRTISMHHLSSIGDFSEYKASGYRLILYKNSIVAISYGEKFFEFIKSFYEYCSLPQLWPQDPGICTKIQAGKQKKKHEVYFAGVVLASSASGILFKLDSGGFVLVPNWIRKVELPIKKVSSMTIHDHYLMRKIEES